MIFMELLGLFSYVYFEYGFFYWSKKCISKKQPNVLPITTAIS